MVASHTWAHKDLTTLSADDINSEMGRVEEALERIIGVKPAFTRPPYGNYNDLVRQVAHSRGQTLVTWDFDSGDSTGSIPEQSKEAYDTLANQHPSTILALNHETYGMRFRRHRWEPSAHPNCRNDCKRRLTSCH
jgi:peptidoglycan/xylan/chitin deacetylase (PgdA/CDA1 family)